MVGESFSYKAGTATVCITPNEPLWLAGYASRTAPAQGKLSDLYVKALTLEDSNGQRFVIASADIIAITRPVADIVAEAVGAQHGIARRQLLLAATHTHYGPEFRSDKQVFFNIPAEYGAKLPAVAEKLAAALIEAIGRALTHLEPVRLVARTTSASFAHNRRRHGVKDGTPSTDDVYDHDMPVLECIDASGAHKAVVFGYACHNTTIPPEDLRYGGDWSGFACHDLQQLNPGATALFVAGAGADQDPEPHGSVELSRTHGLEIAEAVQRSFQTPGVEITGPIRVEMEDVALPLAPVSLELLQRMLASDDPPKRVKARFLLDALDRCEELITSYPVPVQVVRFGAELLLVALSGEPVVDWVHKIKQGAECRGHGEKHKLSDSPLPAPRPPLTWVAGYCNDMFGYLPTRRVQAEGGYEGGRANLWSWIPAPFTDEAEDRVAEAIGRLITNVS